MWLLECCCVRMGLEGIKRIPVWRTFCAWPKALCSSPARLLKPAALHPGQRLCAPQQEASLPTLCWRSGLCSAVLAGVGLAAVLTWFPPPRGCCLLSHQARSGCPTDSRGCPPVRWMERVNWSCQPWGIGSAALQAWLISAAFLLHSACHSRWERTLRG